MITKDILLTLTYLVGAGELALAIFFWVTRSGNEIRKVMALLAFTSGIWSVTNGLTAYVNPSAAVTLILNILYSAGVLTVAAIVHLSIVFPYKTFNLDRLHAWLLYIPALLLSYITFFSKTIVKSYSVAPDNPGFVQPGELHGFFILVVSVYFFSGIAILIKKIPRLDGMHRKNAILTLWGIIIGGFPAILLNAWFILFDTWVNPLFAVVFSLSWVGTTSYIILKK